jgi:hypothetical protein
VRSAPAIRLPAQPAERFNWTRIQSASISGTSVADGTRCTWSSHRERKDRGAMPPSTVSVPEHRHSGSSFGSERQPMDGAPDACAAVDSAQENCK